MAGHVILVPHVNCCRCGNVTEHLSLRDLPALYASSRGAWDSAETVPMRFKCHTCKVIYRLDVAVQTVAEESC